MARDELTQQLDHWRRLAQEREARPSSASPAESIGCASASKRSVSRRLRSERRRLIGRAGGTT